MELLLDECFLVYLKFCSEVVLLELTQFFVQFTPLKYTVTMTVKYFSSHFICYVATRVLYFSAFIDFIKSFILNIILVNNGNMFPEIEKQRSQFKIFVEMSTINFF